MYPTSQQRKAVPLLDRFRCEMCTTWKPNAQFSKKQLDSYTSKIATGQSVNGHTARLRCLACGGQSHELKCLRCGNIYALEMFSKQARKNGGSQWCKQCTSWKLAQEPGVTTAATSIDIAPDEQEIFDTTSGGFGDDDQGAMSDPEGGYSDDDDYDSITYGYQSTLGPHLETVSAAPGALYQGLGALSISGATETQTVTQPFGLPLRDLASNGSTYTAYDAQGNAHQKNRISDTASMASSPIEPPQRSSKWAKPVKTTQAKMVTPVVVSRRTGFDSEEEDM